MPSQELLNFVQASLKAGKSINDIQLELVTNGWRAEDIQEVLNHFNNQNATQTSSTNFNKFLYPMSKIFPKFKNLKTLFLILVLLLIVTAGIFVGSMNKNAKSVTVSKDQEGADKSGFGSLIPQINNPKLTTVKNSQFRLFLKTIPQERNRFTYKLSLVSPDGKLVKTIDTKYQLVLKASLGNMWLLAETFTSCVGSDRDLDIENMTKYCNYWLLHSDGTFNQVVESFNKELVAELGGSQEMEHFFPVSEEDVLYQRCNNADGCKIIKVNLVAGQKQDIPLKGNYEFFDILGVNQDIGKVYLKDSFPRSEQEYRDKIFHLLTVDLKIGQVVDEALKGVSSYYNKYWISPNGKYIAYVIDAGNAVEIFDVEKKQNYTMKLPEGWITSSLGGDTLPTPIWSPDGSKFLFESYFVPLNANEMRATKDIVAYIDVRSRSYVKIYEVDIEKDIIDNEKTKGDYHHQLNGLGWLDNNIAQFSSYRYNNRETNILTISNYEFDTKSKKLMEITSEYGQLLGLYYF